MFYIGEQNGIDALESKCDASGVHKMELTKAEVDALAEALKERIADGEQILYFCPESDGDGFSFDSDIVFFGVDPAEASFENWADQFTKLLKKDGLQLGVGSKGDDVAAIQEYLIALGCLSDAANGVFGPGTEKAVKQFQDDKYLDATGIVDDETRETLFAMELPRNWM